MLYLNAKDLQTIGVDWAKNVGVVEDAVRSLASKDYAQPIKPYLRFGEKQNRIIAMPAFVGGDINFAGIKWIASFPKNIEQGIPRANSVTILNDAATGVPKAIINTAFVSGIRTASVSGVLIKHYDRIRPVQNAKVGIIGFGPIGQLHLQMVASMLGDRISKIRLFDLKGVNADHIPASVKDKVEIVDSWEAAYEDADVFITCTVSAGGYIDKAPKPGSLQLNVSLRDFKPAILDHTKSIIVDDWEEVCRENTDIEAMHKERGLQEADTKSIIDVVCHDAMSSFPAEEAILFNPMGMAVFDIAVAVQYYRAAQEKGVGTVLED